MANVLGTSHGGTIEYRNLTEDKLEESLSVQMESMKYENIAIAVGMYEQEGAIEQMQLIFKEVAKDGCSIIAVEVETDQVVAACFNKIHVS